MELAMDLLSGSGLPTLWLATSLGTTRKRRGTKPTSSLSGFKQAEKKTSTRQSHEPPTLNCEVAARARLGSQKCVCPCVPPP